jgi:signal transduction histidine kinase
MKTPDNNHYESLLRSYLLGTDPVLPAELRDANADSSLLRNTIANRIRIHERIVSTCTRDLTNKRQKTQMLKRAARFFAEVTAIAGVSPQKRTDKEWLKSLEVLSRHALELAAIRKELQQALKEKNDALVILQKNQLHHAQLLKKSENLQLQLRRLSRKLLTAQEDERLKISRDLHDVIAQTLSGINIKLALLKQQSQNHSKNLVRNISSTQRLVEKSVHIVHQFACELRPAVIDDLGLIVALDSLLKKFSARTQIHSSLQTNSPLNTLTIAHRTCLFRVAEEALTNVARHSEAKNVTVQCKKTRDFLSMTIHDDGKSFDIHAASRDHHSKRLGILGMRERVEMIDGTFAIESSPGKGTKIIVKTPLTGFSKGPVATRAKKP